jgi:hypothetical protein
MLCNELIVLIISHLSVFDLFKLRRVDTLWKSLSEFVINRLGISVPIQMVPIRLKIQTTYEFFGDKHIWFGFLIDSRLRFGEIDPFVRVLCGLLETDVLSWNLKYRESAFLLCDIDRLPVLCVYKNCSLSSNMYPYPQISVYYRKIEILSSYESVRLKKGHEWQMRPYFIEGSRVCMLGTRYCDRFVFFYKQNNPQAL